MLKKENLQDIYPLSPMQQGLLFHALYEKDTDTYFLQYSMRIHETTDPHIFENSWNELLKRYEMLRSVFVVKNVPEPLQIVLKHRKIDFYYEDIREIAQTKQEKYLEDFKLKDRKRSFDLEKDVLIRVNLIRLENSLFEFSYSAHHILIDGWSNAILLKDFFQIYNAFKKGKIPDLPHPVSYKNYILWLKSQEPDKAGKYWKNYLKGYSRLSTPNHTYRQEKIDGFDSRNFSFELDGRITNQINDLATHCQVTSNTIIQAIWGILLGRYNDTNDVVFGIVVSGRPPLVKGIERMVGLFINTAPLRIKINPDETIESLLKRIQKEVLEGTQYHHYSLADIQAGTLLKDLLIDHILDFENYPFDQEIQDEVAKISEGMDSVEMFEQANYDLNIIVTPGKKIKFEFSYNGNVYTEEYLKKIGGHISRIASDIGNDPGMKLSDIEMLSDEEKEEYETRKKESDHLKEQMTAEFDF